MTTSSTPTTRFLHAHQRSVARRLLGGAGAAALVVYRRDPEVAHEVLAHALTTSGDLVVAVAEGVATPEGCEVRVDIRREAAEASVRITAATAHLLGRLDLLPKASFDTVGVPEALADLADVPGVAVGLIRAERVLLHHGAGVVPLEWCDVLADGDLHSGFPARADELAVHDVVAGFTPAELREISAAVLADRLEGAQLSRRPVTGHAPPGEQIYCVDVDAFGLTLVHVGEATAVTFIAFPEPVDDAMGVFLTMVGLLMRARS